MKKIVSLFMSRTQYDIRLVLLYALNVFDYLFTLVLISSGIFIEANPILSMNIDGIWGFVLKCIVPLVLLTYLHIRFLTDKPKHERIVKILLDCIIIYYGLINMFHIFWLTVTFVIFM
ncbi:MAG: DUF5658 family protein [Clostridia bacterium]|nr:DUF5658 family protein [Clostridia bacterium]